MKNRNDNIFVYMAAADAYLKPLEFKCNQKLKEDALMFYRYGYLRPSLETLTHGSYNESALFNLVTSAWLINSRVYSNNSFVWWLLSTVEQNNRPIEPIQFHDFLKKMGSNTYKFISEIKTNSIKNGACTRSVPIGVVKDPLEVMDLAEIQAKVTHNTPDGILSSKAIALMSHYALWGNKPLNEIGKYLSLFLPEFTPEKYPINGPLNSQRLGMQTATYVYHILITHLNLMDMMRGIIEIGGDVDNLASICWGIASSRFQNEAIAPFFMKDLESGKYGKDYLALAGKELMDEFDV